MNEDYLLEVKNITKYFPVTKGILFAKVCAWVKAVDGVDLTICPGETLGLVGESGCGKTTIGKLILLMDRLTSGAILFMGKDANKFNERELRQYRQYVQVVFQNPESSLDPRAKVGNIIAEPIWESNNFGKAQIKERVAKALEQVGFGSNEANKYPHQFSGGQKQRIAIARALASNPKLVILDEAIASQDVSIRAQIMNLLKDLQDKFGMGYLFIAHDLASVRYMSTRINVMYLGKIVESATNDELCMNPLHPYTKALLSSSLPVNPNTKRAEVILPGEVCSPLNPPPGCRFHTRCFMAKKICSEREPVLQEVNPGHYVACINYPT